MDVMDVCEPITVIGHGATIAGGRLQGDPGRAGGDQGVSSWRCLRSRDLTSAPAASTPFKACRSRSTLTSCVYADRRHSVLQLLVAGWNEDAPVISLLG
jgi:hypothetical protein